MKSIDFRNSVTDDRNKMKSSTKLTKSIDARDTIDDDEIRNAVNEISKKFDVTSNKNSPIRNSYNSYKHKSNSLRRSNSGSFISKRRSSNIGSKLSIKPDPNSSAIIIQKVIRGYLTRGELLNNERVKLIKMLRDWGYGKVSTLQERKEVQDYNTQGMIRFAAKLSAISSRPIKNLPSKEKLRGYMKGILLKQIELDKKHIIMKNNYMAEHKERELMRHEDSRMKFIYCYEQIIDNHQSNLEKDRLDKLKRAKEYTLKRQQWQMLQYAADKTNVEEGMRKLERELMFLEDMRNTRNRKFEKEAKLNALENERVRMIKEDMTMRTIHSELSIMEEQFQIYKYEATKIVEARREGRLKYGPLARRYGSTINQRVNKIMMSNQYYYYDRYDLNITNSHYTADSSFNFNNASSSGVSNTKTFENSNYYNTFVDIEDSLKSHVFTSLTLSMPTVVKFSEKFVDWKIKLLAMLQPFEFFSEIPFIDYLNSVSTHGIILPVLYSNTNTIDNQLKKSNTRTPDVKKSRYLFKCNIVPHISCRINFYKISALKKIRLLRIDAFKTLVLVGADFVSKHKLLTKIRSEIKNTKFPTRQLRLERIVDAQQVEKLLPEIRLDIIKYGEILLELLFYEVDLICDLFHEEKNVRFDEENELDNNSDMFYNSTTNKYNNVDINNIYVDDIEEEDDDNASVSSELSTASTRSKKPLYAKGTTSKDFLKAAKHKKKKKSNNSRPSTSQSISSAGSNDIDNDNDTINSILETVDIDNSLNIKSNEDEVSNMNNDIDHFEENFEINTKRNQYEQDKDFIWSTNAAAMCNSLPPLPPLKSYNHDEETKLDKKEKKKVDKAIVKKKQKPMSFIDRLKKNVLDDIEEREMADRQKAAKKFDTPGFDYFTDSDATKYDFIYWVDTIKIWIPNVVHWIDSRLKKWKNDNKLYCLNYIQRCYWLIGKMPVGGSSTPQDWSHESTIIDYENPRYHIIFEKADALSLYDLLLCRASYTFSAHKTDNNNTDDIKMNLNSMNLDKYFGKHPASLAVRFLMLMLDSNVNMNTTADVNNDHEMLLNSIINKTIASTNWKTLSSTDISNIDVFDTINNTYNNNNSDDPNMNFEFHKLDQLEKAVQVEFYEFQDFISELLKKDLLVCVSGCSTKVTNTISRKTNMVTDTVVVNHKSTSLLLDNTINIKATDFVYKVATNTSTKEKYEYRCARWMLPMFHWSKTKKADTNHTKSFEAFKPIEMSTAVMIKKQFSKRDLQRFRRIEKRTNMIAKTFYYNITMRIMKRKTSMGAVKEANRIEVDRNMMKFEDCIAHVVREEEWKRREARWGFLTSLFKKPKIFADSWHKPFLASFKIPKQTMEHKHLYHESTKYMKKNISRKVEQRIIEEMEEKMRDIKRVRPWLGEGLGLEEEGHDDDDDDIDKNNLRAMMQNKIIRDIENSMFDGHNFQPMLQDVKVCGGLHHGIVAIVKYDDHNTHFPATTLVDNISSSLSTSNIDKVARSGFVSHRVLCDDNRKTCFATIITMNKRYLSSLALNRLRAIPRQEIASFSTMRMKFLNFFFQMIRYDSNKSSIVLIQCAWRRYFAIKKYFDAESIKSRNYFSKDKQKVEQPSSAAISALSHFLPTQMFRAHTPEEDKSEKLKFIVIIQCSWRRWLSRRIVNKKRRLHLYNISTSIIILMQCAWRTSIANRRVSEKRKIKLRTIKVILNEIITKTITATAPEPGTKLQSYWLKESYLAADHIAAGSIDSAMDLLKSQIALTNCLPLKQHASSIMFGATAYVPGLPLVPSIKNHLHRPTKKLKRQRMPSISLKVSWLFDEVMSGYKLFSNAKFSESLSTFRNIIQAIPLIVATSVTEVNDAKTILGICREYLIALKVKQALHEPSTHVSRVIELAAYFTHCKLQPPHNILALRFAMTTAYNEENYAHAATFARRLLDLPSLVLDSNSELKAKVQATLEKCKQNENNKFFVYDYDDSKSFQLDAVILKPIYEGEPFIQCSYCSSVYYPESIGKLCVICCISSIGGNSNAEGLVLQRPGSSLGSRPSTTLDSSIRVYNDRPGTT